MRRNLILLAALLGSEALAASLLLDGDTIQITASTLAAVLRFWGAWVLRWAIGAALLLGVLLRLRHAETLAGLLRMPPRISGTWLACHAAGLTGFAVLSHGVYSGSAASDFTIVSWAAAAAFTAVTAACAFAPVEFWREALRRMGALLPWAAVCSAAACVAGAWVQHLWEPAARLTFLLVRILLSPVLSEMILQPEIRRLGSSKFTVIIAPECSGLEGMGLLLIFGILWLFLFREDLRFPRALLVLPGGMLLLYLLNAVRIAALALIGHAGFKQIALRGFHSQAGWIAFNLVAFAILIGARRLRWLWRQEADHTGARPHSYPALPYLAPLLAILAAGMVSRAFSADFEWAYPLRLVAGLGALLYFRRHYADIDWHCGWAAPLTGAAAFLLWVGFDWSAGHSPMPQPLREASDPLRLSWILLRTLAAVVTVPVAEELAFRAFGLRRLVSHDFEAVPWRIFHPVALGVSAALFGVMHSGRWLEGTAAGALYGSAMGYRGRFGDAAVAHAITNALLAFFVVANGRWDLW